MGNINREDMLELTRRMTIKRNCFNRIAGAYFDEEGYVDGSFNTHFLKLTLPEQTKNLEIAKAIPFAKTNVELTEYRFSKEEEKAGSIWQILMALRECELKNDALLDVLYEKIGEEYALGGPFAAYFFFGNYDVPLKGLDKEEMWESEEVYRFLICALCPITEDYEPGEPMEGLIFPAFKDRGTDIHCMNVYKRK